MDGHAPWSVAHGGPYQNEAYMRVSTNCGTLIGRPCRIKATSRTKLGVLPFFSSLKGSAIWAQLQRNTTSSHTAPVPNKDQMQRLKQDYRGVDMGGGPVGLYERDLRGYFKPGMEWWAQR